MKNRIGFLAGLDFVNWKPEKILTSLAELGYRGIEWTLAHFNPRTKSPEELNVLVSLTRKHGMEVSEIVVQQDIVSLNENQRKDRIKLIKECIASASATGLNTINLFTGPVPWDPKAPKLHNDIPEGKAWDMVFEAYDEIVPLAEKYKINLAVEGVFKMVCHDFYTTRLLIDRYNSDFLGVNMDPSHDILYGNMDVGWVVKQWGNKIKHVHIKDCVGVVDNFIFPLIGEGLVDWSSFFKALAEIGYKGFCSVEFESFDYYRRVLDNDPVKAAEISMGQVKKLMFC